MLLRAFVDGERIGFEALGDPLAALGRGDVHELGADGGTVAAAGFGSIRAGDFKLGNPDGRKILIEWIELRLKVAPATEDFESRSPIGDLFALGGLLFGGLGLGR